MAKEQLEITPSVTVHKLLEEYPELEEVLIKMAPPFKKLRNPILRRTVARVATIKHISSVGKIPLTELIRNLRQSVGQPPGDDFYEDEIYIENRPDWFHSDKVVISFDESESAGKERMTIVEILEKAKEVKSGELIELKTSFLPAPGIEILKSKGYAYWVNKLGDDEYRSYFQKP